MPASYGDPVHEHRHVRTSVGVIDLSYLGVLEISGGEGAQFLHGLVTNDIKGMKPGEGMRAAFLTGHGKVRALCRVLALAQGRYLVINDPNTHEKVLKYVQPFSYAGDFKVEDVTDRHRIVSVHGPGALPVLKEVSFEPVPVLPSHGWTTTIIAGHNVMIVRSMATGEQGYDICVSGGGLKDVWDFVILKGAFHSIAPFGHRALDSLRIEAGVPVYDVDVTESNMMLETGLADAVSFTKGCYTGQEAVAMATYRGHVSKRLSGLAVAGSTVPSPGEGVWKGGKEIGQITSSLRSPTLGSIIALAYLKHGYYESGTTVEIHSGGQLEAVVTDLPFVRGGASE
jgi:folate-binding protein YgfZ